MRLEFGADSQLSDYRNDTLLSQKPFSYIKGYTYARGQILDVVKSGGATNEVTIRQDTLIMTALDDSETDRGYYVRSK